MTLKLGSNGAEVKAWQVVLQRAGYSVAADGEFGAGTDAATRALQRAKGLDPDGAVGPATLAAGNQATAATQPAPPSAPSSARLSAAGREMIKRFEGFSLTAYPDAAGYSIGYGHFGASKGQTISKAEADRFFDLDVSRFELAVAAATPRAQQHEFDAMTSLAYNIGSAAFARSTVAVRHNASDRQGAADAFLMWNQSEGKILDVLKKRRERERAVYLHGHSGSPPPVAAASSAPSSAAARGAVSLPLVIALGAAGVLLFLLRR